PAADLDGRGWERRENFREALAMPKPAKPEGFDAVLNAELGQVDQRRRRRGFADASDAAPGGAADGSAEERLQAARQEAHRLRLAGLAFSGGGIRSATFNLGFLQGLAGLRLLGLFDYLSTVSGGGYVGAWLA